MDVDSLSANIQQTFFSGLTSDGTLTAHFTAWKILHNLPHLKLFSKLSMSLGITAMRAPHWACYVNATIVVRISHELSFANVYLGKSKITTIVDYHPSNVLFTYTAVKQKPTS